MILWRNIKNYPFYQIDSDFRFPPFLLYVRWKSGVTFVRRCFRDDFRLHRPCSLWSIISSYRQQIVGKHVNIVGFVNLQHPNLIHLPINAVVQCNTRHSRGNINDRNLIFVKILLLRKGNEKVLPLVVHGIIECDLVIEKQASSVLVFGSKPSALSDY